MIWFIKQDNQDYKLQKYVPKHSFVWLTGKIIGKSIKACFVLRGVLVVCVLLCVLNFNQNIRSGCGALLRIINGMKKFHSVYVFYNLIFDVVTLSLFTILFREISGIRFKITWLKHWGWNSKEYDVRCHRGLPRPFRVSDDDMIPSPFVVKMTFWGYFHSHAQWQKKKGRAMTERG